MEKAYRVGRKLKIKDNPNAFYYRWKGLAVEEAQDRKMNVYLQVPGGWKLVW